MNEKQKILVLTNHAAQPKASSVKIIFIGPAPEMKPNSDAFAVDWQLEGPGVCAKNKFSSPRHNLALGQTNSRK
jgi:hypothetical protein